MPNRILRPWVDSEAVNSLSEAAEVFFVRLIMCADDFGRYYGSPQLLKSYLYPLKDKRVADISRLIAECEKAGLIAIYEVSGKRYVQILNFKQRTRQSESKFETPPPEILALLKDDMPNEKRGKMTVKRRSIDCQLTVNCQSSDSQASVNCLPNTETETETIKKDSEINSSSFSPKPGAMPGDSGKRNADKAVLTFAYEGDGKVHGITPELLAYWREMFPAIDVEAELKSASAWLDANRKNRKSDIKRFLVNWLKRTQERAPRVPRQTQEQPSNGEGWSI